MPTPGRLDPASRRVIVRFCFELGWFGFIALAPAAAGMTQPGDAAAALGTYCSFAALLRVFVAVRRRERAGGASLNGWDECLALVGASMLAYFAARMLA